MFTYKTTTQHTPPSIFPIELYHINKDPNRWFVYWLRSSVASGYSDYTDTFDPSTVSMKISYNAAVSQSVVFRFEDLLNYDNPDNLDVFVRGPLAKWKC